MWVSPWRQVASTPSLAGVLGDLLDEDGCELYLRPPRRGTKQTGGEQLGASLPVQTHTEAPVYVFYDNIPTDTPVLWSQVGACAVLAMCSTHVFLSTACSHTHRHTHTGCCMQPVKPNMNAPDSTYQEETIIESRVCSTASQFPVFMSPCRSWLHWMHSTVGPFLLRKGFMSLPPSKLLDSPSPAVVCRWWMPCVHMETRPWVSCVHRSRRGSPMRAAVLSLTCCWHLHAIVRWCCHWQTGWWCSVSTEQTAA